MSIIVAAFLMLAPQTAAPTPAPTPAPVVKVKKERKICRSEETSGTRMGPQTCRTKTEWDEIAEARRKTRDQDDGPRVGSPPQ